MCASYQMNADLWGPHLQRRQPDLLAGASGGG